MFLFFLLLLGSLQKWGASAQQCTSYGIDYVNGGSYFINAVSNETFSFLTQFEGCVDEGSITPILVDPFEEEYFCSDIPTSPDDTSFTSTCTGLLKSQMVTGTWYIVIEGFSFAYVRTFYLTVGDQTTITATPTVTIGVTSTPNVSTITTTNTTTLTSTLPTSTTTIPCKTLTKTRTITPPAVTVVITVTATKTLTIKTISTTSSTILLTTASCIPPAFSKAPDPVYTGQKILIPAGQKRRGVPDVALKRNLKKLLKRGPDLPTVTTTETTFTASTTTTTVLVANTTTETAYTTTTTIKTPVPLTVCSGITRVSSTVTLPTPTRTLVTHTRVTVYVTKTISAIRTIHKITTPPPVSTSCYLSGGTVS